jgi:hypothetical protein
MDDKSIATGLKDLAEQIANEEMSAEERSKMYEKYIEFVTLREGKSREALELMGELKQSMAFEKLWPEVFDSGKATSKWTSKHPAQLKRGEDPLSLLTKLTVTSGTGEERVFDAKEALDAGVNPPTELR